MTEASGSKTDTGSKATVHARVVAELKNALMNGDFVPGQRLVVRDLAERFKTSPMPVREGLRQLVSDGALIDNAHRGVIVPEATVTVISDLVRVRCLIEGSAAEWAASTITAPEIDIISALNQRMSDRAAHGDRADYLTLNREFHFTVYRAARSEVMVPIIERMWLRAGPWLNIMREGVTLGQGLDHHTEIIDSLIVGDGARARRALAADISDAGDILMRAAASPVAGHSRSSLKSAQPGPSKPG